LLGERDQAFNALVRAFNEGYRGELSEYCTRGEDNPLFDRIRSDPRLRHGSRLRAENARQLAQLASQRAPDQ
jgi:hypothetical protein